MNIVVLGAAGHIGSAVARRLHGDGHTVTSLVKNHDQIPRVNGRGCAVGIFNVVTRLWDPCAGESSLIDALIYCVGHCPLGGFKTAVNNRLWDTRDLGRELDLHAFGVLNSYQQFLEDMQPSGHMIFMSSAATRLLGIPYEKRPPIQIYGHLAAIAAGDALIEGMRMDPATIARGLKIHRVMPPAISDSPFHQVEGGCKLPVTVTTKQVVEAIVGLLSASSHTNLSLVPAPATPA